MCIVFVYENGSYNVIGDFIGYVIIFLNEFVELIWFLENWILLKVNGMIVDMVSWVELVVIKMGLLFVYSLRIFNIKECKYYDDVEIFLNGKGLIIVNFVDMENYLDGVVELEGGNGYELEYYKVQVLMS